MKANWKTVQGIASMLLVSAVLAGCAAGPGAPSAELRQRIESARTRADHVALGTYYEQQAATALGRAAEHRGTAKAYTNAPVGSRGGMSMATHCNAIVRQYEEIARNYETMAAEHRKMGETAP